MALKDQCDGVFMARTPLQLRPGDVLLRPARQVLRVHVTITTGEGTETVQPWEPLRIFRPVAPALDEPCPQCDAEAGQPCAPDCLGLALLEDASHEVFGEGPQ